MVHSYMFKVCVVFVCMVIWSTVSCSKFVLYLCMVVGSAVSVTGSKSVLCV